MSKRKVSQSLLTDMFKKRAVTAGSSGESANSLVAAADREHAPSAPPPPPPPAENEGKPSTSPHHPNDIGLYADKILGVNEKYDI